VEDQVRRAESPERISEGEAEAVTESEGEGPEPQESRRHKITVAAPGSRRINHFFKGVS
jgi:hypothetical protein